MGKLAEYYRVSLKDQDKQDADSQSIDGQRKLVHSFISRNDELSGLERREYIDDGYTGTNFDRPQFKAMMEDAKRGLVDCIIVKDLSRFGRNYIDVGDYMEHIFPFLGIRFIAVNDSYDSSNFRGKTGGIDFAFRNFIYDSYSKDLSVKVRSAMRVRMEQGQFVSNAPYGYMRSPDNKHSLLPDPETAPIVRHIFLQVINGRSTSEIARELNLKQIPTPLEYRKAKPRTGSENLDVYWSHTKVLNILHNYKYTGAMINHTKESRYLRDRSQRRVPREEWIITEGAHEAIVSKEEFELAGQAIRHINYIPHEAKDTSDRVFYCGHCGHKLRKTFGNDVYFSCGTPYNRTDADCGSFRWSRTDLDKTLLPIYKTQLELLGRKASEEYSQKRESKGAELTKLISQLEKSLASCDREKISLYESYKNGDISRENFIDRKAALDKRKAAIKDDIKCKSDELSKAEQEQESRDAALSEANVYLHGLSASPENIVREMYAAIDRVEIFDNEHLSVSWKFKDLFSNVEPPVEKRKIS